MLLRFTGFWYQVLGLYCLSLGGSGFVNLLEVDLLSGEIIFLQSKIGPLIDLIRCSITKRFALTPLFSLLLHPSTTLVLFVVNSLEGFSFFGVLFKDWLLLACYLGWLG